MTGTHRLIAALTSLDGLQAVEAVASPLAEAIGCVAADTEPSRAPIPPFHPAIADGWAMRARDLAGASAYAPLPLPAAPVWVEAGQPLPIQCGDVRC